MPRQRLHGASSPTLDQAGACCEICCCERAQPIDYSHCCPFAVLRTGAERSVEEPNAYGAITAPSSERESRGTRRRSPSSLFTHCCDVTQERARVAGGCDQSAGVWESTTAHEPRHAAQEDCSMASRPNLVPDCGRRGAVTTPPGWNFRRAGVGNFVVRAHERAALARSFRARAVCLPQANRLQSWLPPRPSSNSMDPAFTPWRAVGL
jgi:hypothetical protein